MSDSAVTSAVSVGPPVFHAPATPDISTLSLHDALPISQDAARVAPGDAPATRADRVDGDHGETRPQAEEVGAGGGRDRKSTRLNSSHVSISYAVFCLKKKKKTAIWSIARVSVRHALDGL